MKKRHTTSRTTPASEITSELYAVFIVNDDGTLTPDSRPPTWKGVAVLHTDDLRSQGKAAIALEVTGIVTSNRRATEAEIAKAGKQNRHTERQYMRSHYARGKANQRELRREYRRGLRQRRAVARKLRGISRRVAAGKRGAA